MADLTVIRPPFYAPRPSDTSEQWVGRPIASALLAVLLVAGGQPHTKQWHYDYDVGESVWQGQPRASALLHPLLTASGQVPTKQWEWHYDDASVWQGQPRASALLHPLLTASGQVPTKQWEWHSDDSSVWQGKPTASALLAPLLTAAGKPQTHLSWQFNPDDPPPWQLATARNIPLLQPAATSTLLPRAAITVPNYSDEGPWPGPPHRNLALNSAAVANPLVRAAMFVPTYIDDGPWWEPFTSALEQIPGQVQTYLWRWDYDDSSPWAPSLARNQTLLQPAVAATLVRAAQFVPTYNVGESYWVGQPAPSALLHPLLTASGSVKAKLWTWDYNEGGLWVGQPTPKSIALVSVTSPVIPPSWRFNYDDSAPWQFGFQPHLELLTAVLQPEVSQPPWNWDYTYEETVPWQFQFNVGSLRFPAGAPVTAKLWTWDYAETGAWNASPVAGLILNKLLNTGRVPPLRQFASLYATIDDAVWVGRPVSNTTAYEVPPPPAAGTLYITEFRNIGFHNQGDSHSDAPYQVATLPPIAEQIVPIASSPNQSVTFNINTNFIRLCSDIPCSVLVQVSPFASVLNMRLSPNEPEYFGLPSVGLKTSVIQNT